MGALVNRIEKEFILTNVMKTEELLSVHGNKKEALYRMNNYAEETLDLLRAEKSGVSFRKDEMVRVFFSFQSNYYTFDCKVIEAQSNTLTVVNPKSICRNPQRKYERIKLNDIEVAFELEGDKVELDFPKTDTFSLVEKPQFSDLFNPQSIADLITTFRNFVHNKISDHKIVMYRDRLPQSFEEKITTKLGKVLWIENTEGDFPLADPVGSGTIIIKKEVEDYLESTGIPRFLLKSEVSNVYYNKAKAGIQSEIYCPVLYHEYAVGYIYVINKKTQKPLDEEFLQYVITFAKVLSYSLEINGYYKQYKKNVVEYKMPVLDISASGLLFATRIPELNEKIKAFLDFDITIKFAGKTITAGSRVMRKFNDTQYFYFAAQFLKIAEEQFNSLFEYLYGKSFSEKDEMNWEGGVPPPAL